MEITNTSIVVYAKRQNKLCFFKIYDFEKGVEAQQKFAELMQDASVSEYRMMTIDSLSEILEAGCNVLDF